jgi:transcriptional regulator with XRE-family HTH domain
METNLIIAIVYLNLIMYLRKINRNEAVTESQKKILYKVIGENISRYLKMKNVKQSDLASKLDKNKASISNIISGNRQVSLHFLIDIAIELNIEPSLLIPSSEEIKVIFEEKSTSMNKILENKGVSDTDQNTILNLINL